MNLPMTPSPSRDDASPATCSAWITSAVRREIDVAVDVANHDRDGALV